MWSYVLVFVFPPSTLQWAEILTWSFPFGFGNPLEGFLYGPTCAEEIMFNKALTALSIRQVCGE